MTFFSYFQFGNIQSLKVVLSGIYCIQKLINVRCSKLESDERKELYRKKRILVYQSVLQSI